MRLHDIGSSTQTTHSTPYHRSQQPNQTRTEPLARPFSDPSDPTRHVKPSICSASPSAILASPFCRPGLALAADVLCTLYKRLVYCNVRQTFAYITNTGTSPQDGFFQLHMRSRSGRHGDDGLCSVVRGLLEHCDNAFGYRVADNHIARQRHVHNRLLRDRYTTGELWLLQLPESRQLPVPLH